MSRISIQGGIGAALLIVVIIAAMLAELAALRGPVLGSIVCGLLFGGGWILWRRRRPLDSGPAPLSLGLAAGRRRPR